MKMLEIKDAHVGFLENYNITGHSTWGWNAHGKGEKKNLGRRW